jgi:hypothetical protein
MYLANPKSASFAPESERKMLAGFMSRWMIRFSARVLNPLKICAKMTSA